MKNADGSVTAWRIEGNTPNSLLRVGLNKKSLEPGTEVAVRGYRSRSGENVASGSSIVFKGGSKLSLGSEADAKGENRAAVLEWISSDEEIWKKQIVALKADHNH